MRQFLSIKNLIKLNERKGSAIYFIDKKTIVKIYKNKDFCDVEPFYNNHKNLYELGFPVPNAYNIVDTEKGLGITCDYIFGGTISERIRKEPYKFIKYDRGIERIWDNIDL